MYVLLRFFSLGSSSLILDFGELFNFWALFFSRKLRGCFWYLSCSLSHSLFDPLSVSFFQSGGSRSKSLVFISSTAAAATGSSQPELSQVFTADLKRDECKGLKARSINVQKPKWYEQNMSHPKKCQPHAINIKHKQGSLVVSKTASAVGSQNLCCKSWRTFWSVPCGHTSCLGNFCPCGWSPGISACPCRPPPGLSPPSSQIVGWFASAQKWLKTVSFLVFWICEHGE